LLFQNHFINKEKIRRDIIVIGASAGGVTVLRQLFSVLPTTLTASILVALHRGPARSQLPEVLNLRSSWTVVEAEDGMAMERNRVYLAPSDHHLRIGEQDRLKIDRGPKEHGTRPAVDPLFRDAARRYGSRVVGVILTGCGDDGVAGMIAIKGHGGLCLAQNPAESYMPSMPENAIRYDDVDQVLSLTEVVPVLVALANGEEVKANRLDKSPRSKRVS
jgi:two-component system chemotaxis response regulator CheB